MFGAHKSQIALLHPHLVAQQCQLDPWFNSVIFELTLEERVGLCPGTNGIARTNAHSQPYRTTQFIDYVDPLWTISVLSVGSCPLEHLS